jgi:hypothetical protein
LGAAGSLGRDSFSAAEVAVPDVSRHNRTLCVATQLAMTVSEAEEATILRQLAEYNALLFRPGLLVRSRESATAQEELLEHFRAAGFAVMREYPLQNLVYCAKDVADSVPASRAPRRLGALARALRRWAP